MESRPPRTLPSAEPKPVMLRGTDSKASRFSIREQPSHPVKLIVARVVEPGHVAPGRERRVALDPEDGYARDADLDIQLPERPAGKRQRRAARAEPRHAPAPRLRRGLDPQREDPAPVHPPEPRIERERHARVVGRLEVVPAPHDRVEVPAGELQSGQQAHHAARREIAGALRGPESGDGPRPTGTPNRANASPPLWPTSTPNQSRSPCTCPATASVRF